MKEPNPIAGRGNRSALVTGGAGFIGSHLADALIGDGWRVSILDDLSTGSLDNVRHLLGNPGFHYAIDTVTNEVVLDRLVSENDVVFHLAAAVGVDLIVSDPLRVIESNVIGSHAVLRAARRYGRKVLVASSSEIYGKSEASPFSEGDDRLLGPTTSGRWSYSTSKAIGEYLALAYHRQWGLPAVVFRLFNTVGPRQTGRYGMVVPRFVEQAMAGEPLTVYEDGRQTRSFCDVADVVRAIIALAEAPGAVGQVFNIGATSEVTILELADMVQRVVKGDRTGSESVVFIPYEDAFEPGFEDMRRRVPDTAKLTELTGWRPEISLETTLRRIITSHD